MTTPFPAATAALERLAAALDPREFTTTLTTGTGRPPRLAVANRDADIGGDIYADHAAYWWSWSERIASVTDPSAAARRVSAALRAIPAARP